ncbi:MAG TPA: adenylate kinase [Thermoanaerobaculia bacterium]|nr:adenylate kinase [Thermoanaerobaculia bacterium]
MRLIFIGPPGSGKGTQAKRLAARHQVPHISTGDMLRDAIADDTPLGREAAPIMAAGALVPDDLMIGIIKDRLAKPDAGRGFILDGFPRTTVQAEKLDNIVGNGSDPVRVVQLLVPDDVLVKRTVLRRSCPDCGAIYHLESAPPKNDMVCDREGAALIHRPDDNEEAVRKRLDAFHRQTLPVVTFYKAKNVLRTVDGVGPLDEVFERIEKSLA